MCFFPSLPSPIFLSMSFTQGGHYLLPHATKVPRAPRFRILDATLMDDNMLFIFMLPAYLFLWALLLASGFVTIAAGPCASLAECSGHGTCVFVGGAGSAPAPACACDTGWGSNSDIAELKAADCSLRTCAAAPSWAAPAWAGDMAVRECAGAGLCDRMTGACRCFAGYEGEACQRLACAGSPPCSARGRCLPLRALLQPPQALDFTAVGDVNATNRSSAVNISTGQATATATDDDGQEEEEGVHATGAPPHGVGVVEAWEEGRVHGCACDSAWAVGYSPGASQLAQTTGVDCSQTRCPSGDDPRTPVDETDCEWFDDKCVLQFISLSRRCCEAGRRHSRTACYRPLPAPLPPSYDRCPSSQRCNVARLRGVRWSAV